MIWLSLGIIVILIGLVILAFGLFYNSFTHSDSKPLAKGAGLVIILFGFLLIIPGAIYTQDPGEVILIRGSGGDIKDTDTSAGFGVTAPWNKRIKFDTRNQRIEMFTNSGGQGENGAAIGAPLSNGTNVTVSVTVQYSMRPDCIEDVYNTYRSQANLEDRALEPGLRDGVRQSTAEYDPFRVKQERAQLATDIRELLESEWEELCVEIDNVDLGDLGLPETTEAALNALNDRQLEAQAAQADLEKAKIEAEVTKTDALAEQAADQIVRCGATVTTETREVAGQETEVQIVTPVPVEQCQNLLNEQVLINNWIEAMKEMAANGNVIVVDPNAGTILDVARPGAQ